MRRLTIFLFILAALNFKGSNLFALMNLIDIPTAEVNDKYSMEMDFRLYSRGGTVSLISFGVFQQLTLGCSLDIESLIGTDNPKVRPPALNIKAKLYQGTKNLPSIVLGYDGQGYLYDDTKGEYQQKERGIYLAGSMEALAPNTQLYFGANVAFSKENSKSTTDLFGFTGLNYSVKRNERDIMSFIIEVDHLFRTIEESRCNMACRIFPVNNFNIGIALKNIRAKTEMPMDRQINIAYITQF